MNLNKVGDIIWEGDVIIGYGYKIIEVMSLEDGELEDDEESADLLEQLEEHEDDLVICNYHPMGSWMVTKLVEERK